MIEFDPPALDYETIFLDSATGVDISRHYEKKVMLARQNEEVSVFYVETSAPWVVTDRKKVRFKKAGDVQTLTLIINPDLMALGENEAVVRISPRRNNKAACSLNVRAKGDANCIVPYVHKMDINLGKLNRNETTVNVPVEVWWKGNGNLRGLLYSRYGRISDVFEITEDMSPPYTISSNLRTNDLACMTEGEATIIIDTDCQVKSMKTIEVRVLFERYFLKKSLPYLDFIDVAPGDERSHLVTINRSDNKRATLEFEVPVSIRKALCIEKKKADTWNFCYKSHLKEDSSKTHLIVIRDNMSGIKDSLPVLVG